MLINLGVLRHENVRETLTYTVKAALYTVVHVQHCCVLYDTAVTVHEA